MTEQEKLEQKLKKIVRVLHTLNAVIAPVIKAGKDAISIITRIESGLNDVYDKYTDEKKDEQQGGKMNFDRFGFKAISERQRRWLYASLDLVNNCFRTNWHLEPNGETSFSMAWIKPETICQCTGLRDSDGRLIYEHDIIEAKDVKGIGFYEKSEVLWDGCEWSKKSGIVCSIRGLIDLYEKGEVTIRVIGNKFDKEEK